MQRQRSHVDDANSSLAMAQASEATVAEEVVGATVQPDGRATIKGSQTTRTRANNAAGRHAQGLGPRCYGIGTAWAWVSSRASLSSDHSVGSKGGFLQAKIGPVDG